MLPLIIFIVTIMCLYNERESRRADGSKGGRGGWADGKSGGGVEGRGGGEEEEGGARGGDQVLLCDSHCSPGGRGVDNDKGWIISSCSFITFIKLKSQTHAHCLNKGCQSS